MCLSLRLDSLLWLGTVHVRAANTRLISMGITCSLASDGTWRTAAQECLFFSRPLSSWHHKQSQGEVKTVISNGNCRVTNKQPVVNQRADTTSISGSSHKSLVLVCNVNTLCVSTHCCVKRSRFTYFYEIRSKLTVVCLQAWLRE